jgi:hypothetical protein
MRRHLRSALTLVLGCGVTWLAAPTPGNAGAVDPVPVVKTKKVEILPGAGAGWLAWSESRLKKRPQFNVVAQPDGGTPFRVNPPDTQGFDAFIEGDQLVYSQARGKPDIGFFDLSSRTHTTPPSGVNTTQVEIVPSTSGDWLMFMRSQRLFRGTAEIILRNVVTGEARILDKGDFDRDPVQAGNLAGDFATWIHCRNRSLSRCNVRRYQISTGTMMEIPNPRSRAQFANSVTSDGTIYFIESGNLLCGKHAALWRFTTTGSRERLAPLGRGLDSARTSPLVSGMTTTIFFDLVDCEKRIPTGDIYKVTV